MSCNTGLTPAVYKLGTPLPLIKKVLYSWRRPYKRLGTSKQSRNLATLIYCMDFD